MSSILTAKPRQAHGSARPKIVVFLAAVASIFVLAACHFVGSGTVVSAFHHGKATFTFDLNCPSSGNGSGVLTYVDSPARVMVHAVVPGTALRATCGTPEGGVTPKFGSPTTFHGSYTPLNPGLAGGGGTFSVTVSAGGTASPFPGSFAIAFFGGAYSGYTNSGPIQWGNIVSA